MRRLHQLSGPVGRSINLHKTDIKSLSSRDAARRAEVVRVVSSTISIKMPHALDKSLANHSMIQIVQYDVQTDLQRLRNRRVVNPK